jgi:hypothetical protein
VTLLSFSNIGVFFGATELFKNHDPRIRRCLVHTQEAVAAGGVIRATGS